MNSHQMHARGYVQAVRCYWLAYYRLGLTTLHDFAEGREIR